MTYSTVSHNHKLERASPRISLPPPISAPIEIGEHDTARTNGRNDETFAGNAFIDRIAWL